MLSTRKSFGDVAAMTIGAERERSESDEQAMAASTIHAGFDCFSKVDKAEIRMGLDTILYGEGTVSGDDHSLDDSFKYQLNYSKSGIGYHLTFSIWPTEKFGLQLSARYQIVTITPKDGFVEFDGQRVTFPDRGSREMRGTDLLFGLNWRFDG